MKRITKIYLGFSGYMIFLLMLSYLFQKQLFVNSLPQAVYQFISTVFIELMIFGWILMIVYAGGRWFLDLLKFKFDTELEKIIFSVGIGLGFISYTIFILSVFKLLYFSVVFVILFAATILFIS
ncbi:MAG: hypothetical protein Q7K21_09495, partial [Elusimicrobiota bacterium]|nr:hypothetical protein [Elusimicrobiota bacterium]